MSDLLQVITFLQLNLPFGITSTEYNNCWIGGSSGPTLCFETHLLMGYYRTDLNSVMLLSLSHLPTDLILFLQYL